VEFWPLGLCLAGALACLGKAPNRRVIAAAARKNGGASAQPEAVLTELTFGFWAHLADAAHEQRLWIPYIYYA